MFSASKKRVRDVEYETPVKRPKTGPFSTPSTSRLGVPPLTPKKPAVNEHITVGIRIKKSDATENVVFDENSICVAGKSHTYDFVAQLDQEELFNTYCKPVVEASLEGYNGCILAYGQTGSGKTYTIIGPEQDSPSLRGVIPRTFQYLLSKKLEKKFEIGFSALEIYNEQLADLLQPTNEPRVFISGKVTFERLKETKIGTLEEALNSVYQSIHNRKKRDNGINCQSSRSHALFIIRIRYEDLEPIQLMIVDLAGSEGTTEINFEGAARTEASTINKSLLSLKKVVSNLACGQPTNYRESKLTMCLKDCLGGNSNVLLIGTINPEEQHMRQTKSTLEFVADAKRICNNVTKVAAKNSTIAAASQQQSELIAQLLERIEELEKAKLFIEEEKLILEEKVSALEMEKAALQEENENRKSKCERLESQLQKSRENTRQLEAENRKLQTQVTRLKAKLTNTCTDTAKMAKALKECNPTLAYTDYFKAKINTL